MAQIDNSRQSYPLLNRLLIYQGLAIIIAVTTLAVVTKLTLSSKSAAALSEIRGVIRPVLDKNLEKWIAWKQFGLNEPVEEEFTALKKEYPIASIALINIEKGDFEDSPETIMLPDNDSVQTKYKLVCRIDMYHIKSKFGLSNLSIGLLGILLAFFCLVIWISGNFIKSYMYLPIQQLTLSMQEIMNGKEMKIEHIEARGEIKSFILAITNLYLSAKRAESYRATSRLAAQVAHDIRSPLSALNVVLGLTPEIPDEKRVLARSAIARINDIANNLLEKYRSNISGSPAAVAITDTAMEATPQLMSSVIDSLVSEKRLQFRKFLNLEINFEVESESYGLFSKIDPAEFKRVLSNIINNSVEALAEKRGRVQVSLIASETRLLISVRDNGRGIAASVLPLLGIDGQSFGKGHDGSGFGLGLSHAKDTIERLGGSLNIESREGAGTTVNICLRLASPPSWFVEKLVIAENSRIVVVDDDSSIHQLWRNRIGSACPFNLELLHFSTPDDFTHWFTNPESKESIYLIDYEFTGAKLCGLDLIEKLQISKNAILVTSRFEEDSIFNRACNLGVRWIPKDMSGVVPIEFTKSIYFSEGMKVGDASSPWGSPSEAGLAKRVDRNEMLEISGN